MVVPINPNVPEIKDNSIRIPPEIMEYKRVFDEQCAQAWAARIYHEIFPSHDLTILKHTCDIPKLSGPDLADRETGRIWLTYDDSSVHLDNPIQIGIPMDVHLDNPREDFEAMFVRAAMAFSKDRPSGHTHLKIKEVIPVLTLNPEDLMDMHWTIYLQFQWFVGENTLNI